MGGADAVVEKARQSFDDGDYRWVAEVLNHVVMSEPEHGGARALLADTFEQLGYQAESAVWRNFYLCGALELRSPVESETSYATSAGMALGIPLDNIFKAMAVRLDGAQAAGSSLNINLDFTDLSETWLLSIENAVLRASPGKRKADADASLTLSSLDFKRLMTGLTDGLSLIAEEKMVIDGDADALINLTSLFVQFPRRYPIVTPRQMPE
jgi:alkyl sulfatase BDS1-like metallo-beta-lactamase superfamily hydrolase